MGAIREYFAAIGRSVLSIADGLAVTSSYMLRKPITIQYPDRIPEPLAQMLPERSRGLLEVDLDICTGCLACARACPIDCIHIEVAKDEEKGRLIHRFDIDLAKCMFCGLCTEACPTGSIRHSTEFEGAMGDVRNLMVAFVDEPRPPAKIKKGEAVEFKPVGSIIRKRLPGAWDKPKPATQSEGGPE